MMKKAQKIEVIEVDGEGLVAMLGERVLLMCVNYYYEGILEGVNDTDVLLSDAGIVYLTGPWDEKAWSDRQAIPVPQIGVKMQAIESYFISPKLITLS